MRAAYTVEQIRAAERPLLEAMPDGALMQRAAGGLATAIADLLGGTYGARVVVAVGSGDNGGDALYAGATLARRGVGVTAFGFGSRLHGAGVAALRTAGGRVYDDVPDAAWSAAVEAADVVVDGIVGIGGRPGLKSEDDRRWRAVREARAAGEVAVVAVDVPSGVSVDDGAVPDTHVDADLTVTFGGEKPCHLIDPAASACGAVHLVDIGLELPAPTMTALGAPDVAALFPVPDASSDKYSRGVLGVVAGSAQYPGAAVLSTSGAVAGGAGMVRYVGPDSVAEAVRTRHPEVVAGIGRVQAWLIGSGLGDDEDTDSERVRAALDGDEPLLVDADGLKLLDGQLRRPALLTPHAGELSRLLDVDRAEIEAHRLRYAQEAAERYAATVLLKGSTTVIAAPDGRVRVNVHGSSWLATAGSGDVLGGLCGALLAAGLEPLDAGSVGAYLHSAGARIAADGAPIGASALPAGISAAIRRCRMTGPAADR